MLFDSFDINQSGDISLEQITFLENWDMEEIEVELPKKPRVRKKEVHIVPPTMAMYRNKWEKDLAEELTERMAAEDRFHSASAYYGFSRAASAQSSMFHTASAQSSIFDVSMFEPSTQQKPPPTPDNNIQRRSSTAPGRKPSSDRPQSGQRKHRSSIAIDESRAELEASVVAMMRERPKPPQFVESTEGWRKGRTTGTGDTLPISFVDPVLMPQDVVAKLAWVEPPKELAPLDLSSLKSHRRSQQTPGYDRFISEADMPSLSALEQYHAKKRPTALPVEPPVEPPPALTDRDGAEYASLA
jgi:hypothetical protein